MQVGFKLGNDSSNGSLQTCSDEETNVRESLRMLLTTSKGSRAGFPDYGCDITSIVFDSLDEFTETIIKQEIVDSISKYEKRVKLLSVNLDRREDSFSVVVRLKYEVLLSGGSSLVVDDII